MIRLVVLFALLGGSAAAQTPPCPFAGQSPVLLVQLFFGQSIAGTRLISRRAWSRFVTEIVTPALPDGFTLTAGTGQYLDPVTHAIGHEPTEILLVAATDTPDLRARVAGVVETFRKRFDQRAVGIVSTPGCAAF